MNHISKYLDPYREAFAHSEPIEPPEPDETDADGHVHAFRDIGVRTEAGEVIEWCAGCEATRDSDGGIIE